jgi:hypothetical protein
MTNKIKKAYSQTKSFDEYAENRLGKEKYNQLCKEADKEAQILLTIQNFITSSLEDYMHKNQVGFNELVRRLEVSPTYVSKMRKGQANLTLYSLARLMATLGKEPHEILPIKKIK